MNERKNVVDKSPEIDDKIYMTIGQIASDTNKKMFRTVSQTSAKQSKINKLPQSPKIKQIGEKRSESAQQSKNKNRPLKKLNKDLLLVQQVGGKSFYSLQNDYAPQTRNVSPKPPLVRRQ